MALLNCFSNLREFFDPCFNGDGFRVVRTAGQVRAVGDACGTLGERGTYVEERPGETQKYFEGLQSL